MDVNDPIYENTGTKRERSMLPPKSPQIRRMQMESVIIPNPSTQDLNRVIWFDDEDYVDMESSDFRLEVPTEDKGIQTQVYYTFHTDLKGILSCLLPLVVFFLIIITLGLEIHQFINSGQVHCNISKNVKKQSLLTVDRDFVMLSMEKYGHLLERMAQLYDIAKSKGLESEESLYEDDTPDFYSEDVGRDFYKTTSRKIDPVLDCRNPDNWNPICKRKRRPKGRDQSSGEDSREKNIHDPISNHP